MAGSPQTIKVGNTDIQIQITRSLKKEGPLSVAEFENNLLSMFIIKIVADEILNPDNMDDALKKALIFLETTESSVNSIPTAIEPSLEVALSQYKQDVSTIVTDILSLEKEYKIENEFDWTDEETLKELRDTTLKEPAESLRKFAVGLINGDLEDILDESY